VKTIRVTAALAVALLSLPLAACGADEERTLTVFAAASLTDVFTDLGETFEADHPGVTVTVNFGGSSDLAAQLVEGAPGDVFASADAPNMEKVVAADLNGVEPVAFASNTLTIVTPADNPAGISSRADLAEDGVDLVLCAPEVPCGAAAEKVEAAAGLAFEPVSEEQSVKDVLAKVVAGEADAGLVYVTDARAAGDAVTVITVPEAAQAANVALITNLETDLDDLSTAFIDLVLGAEGRRALAEAGFGTAP